MNHEHRQLLDENFTPCRETEINWWERKIAWEFEPCEENPRNWYISALNIRPCEVKSSPSVRIKCPGESLEEISTQNGPSKEN